MLEEFNIVLQVSRVASADNLADAASRWLDSADYYKLHPRWFKWLETRYGPHDVDLFATNTNKQLPRFYSRFYCPAAPTDPDPSLFWCNNETAVSGVSLESCKNNLVSYPIWWQW